MEETCKTCPWWERTELSLGECRKNTPEIFLEATLTALHYVRKFPPTRENDWCSKHPYIAKDSF